MKRLNIIALLCAAPLFFACSEKPEPVEPAPVEPQPETRTLTFVLPTYGEEASASMKTAWVAGDQIVVHGEYAAKQVTVTLAASDISSDGKTATKSVDGLYPYVREDCTSNLYASYPAECADNLKHCFFYSKFNSTSTQLLAACNNGDTFQFQDVCGVLSFDIDQEFDSYVISGARKETLGYEFLQVKITDKEQLFKQYLGKSVISLSGDIDGNTVNICMPDGIEISGFTAKFSKEGKTVAICKYTEPVEISRGQVTSLGNISEFVADYEDPFSADVKDLDAGGSANCYIVTEPGKYKFKAVKGNDATAFLNEVADAVVLWETWNNDEEVASNSVVVSASYAEDYMIIHMPETLKPGNAVVAAVDADGAVLWSWHIWVPATAVETSSFGGVYSTDIMDRNLGALVAATFGEQVTAESYGLTYQWGRKDPFPGPSAVGDSDPATVAGVQIEEATPHGEAVALISLEQSIANPTLMGHSPSGDWIDYFDNNLWTDDYKTIYDPCPAGYRVPAVNSSTPMFSSSFASETGWSVDTNLGYITLGNPAVVFPIGGYRDDYSVDGFANVGKRVAIWGARNDGDTTGTHLNWRPDKGTFAVGGTGKSRGCYVRCVKE